MKTKTTSMNNQYTEQREMGFDIVKCICAFLIVCIHVPFPGEVGKYVTVWARIAVPIFLMITGFFYHNTVRKNRELVQIGKNVSLLLGANALYFLWEIFYVIVSGYGLKTYLSEIFTAKSILMFVFLNESPFNGHLWYLGASLYTLIIVYVVRQLNGMKVLFILSPILLIADLMFGKYAILIFGREFSYIYVRNFLFVGIPYFCIGYLIYQYRETLFMVFLQRSKLIVGIVFFSITSFLERFLLNTYGINANRDHYLSTTFLAISVFLFFMITYQGKEMSMVERSAVRIGRQYSALVYIIHPIIIIVLTSILVKLRLDAYLGYIFPLIVYICSVIGVAILYKIKDKLRVTLQLNHFLVLHGEKR